MNQPIPLSPKSVSSKVTKLGGTRAPGENRRAARPDQDLRAGDKKGARGFGASRLELWSLLFGKEGLRCKSKIPQV